MSDTQSTPVVATAVAAAVVTLKKLKVPAFVAATEAELQLVAKAIMVYAAKEGKVAVAFEKSATAWLDAKFAPVKAEAVKLGLPQDIKFVIGAAEHWGKLLEKDAVSAAVAVGKYAKTLETGVWAKIKGFFTKK